MSDSHLHRRTNYTLANAALRACIALTGTIACSNAAIAATAPTTVPATVPTTAPATDAIEEVRVTGTLRDAELLRTPLSVTVIDGDAIRARSARHLEEILNVAPNVNFSSGASRARFFQIRGIGERGQFAEPLDPSVGLIVDDVDLSGAGAAATLFDMAQVEVFRGPQSSRYGANAHAGLIVMRSNAPTREFEGAVELEAGDYDTRRLGAVISGPLAGPDLTGRLALQSTRSDGYIDNDFLGSEDTSEIDEKMLRGRLHWQASEQVSADLQLTRIEVDNGYDAFNYESRRNTRSDAPGDDAQDTTLASVKIAFDGSAGFDVDAIASASDSRIDYGYDEDWTFVGFDPAEYSSTDRYLRDRDTLSLELRVTSDADGRLFGDTTDWLAGIYYHDREVDLTRIYTFLANPFTSEYDTERLAVFGQIGVDLSPSLRLTAGLRHEARDDSYSDGFGVDFDPDDDLWGGRMGLEWALTEDLLAFATIARGYKAGGFNTDGSLDADLREYDSEEVWNYELGAKVALLDDRLGIRAVVFYMDRDDQQVGTSQVRVRADGSAEFIDYVGNAAEGDNLGAELELDWRLSDSLSLSGSLGLLTTNLDDFVNSAGADLSGRDQAQAPNYQFHIAADWRGPRGLFARLEAEGRDDFYWSDSHDEQAQGYELLHVRAGWRSERIEVALYSRNLTDEDYGVRGFGGFGNDPRNGYATEEYVQLGAPRTIGISTRLSF